MIKGPKQAWLLLVGMVILFLTACTSATIPDRPDNSVLDEAGVLSEDTVAYIHQVNLNLAKTQEQYQIGVYLPASLDESIEDVANQVAKKWQVGFAGTNNGILLVLAPNNRKMRIETSNKAATVITDVTAKRILDSARSELREGDYNTAVRKQIQGIIQYLGLSEQDLRQLGVSAEEQSEHAREQELLNGPLAWIYYLGIVAVLVPFAIPLILRLLGRRRRFFTFFDDDDDFFDGFFGGGTGSSGSRFGGSGGSSSSSSSSWGGGGFGGGGASSGW